MKIKRIQVINFRSIKFAEIFPKQFNIFVGQNNHGKTNLFEAVEWFYTNKGNIDHIRHGRQGDSEVSVEIEFEGVQEGIEKMINEKNKSTIKNVIGLTDSVRVKRSSRSGKVRSIYKAETNEWTDKNPLGFDNAFNDFLPRFEYVDTKSRVEDVAKYGKNSPITTMLSGVLEAILYDNDSYREFKEKFETLFSDENSQVRMELNDLSGKVRVYLEKQFPDCSKICFEVNQPLFEDLLKNFSTSIDDGVETDCTEKGDGMQRALMLAIIQAYADFRKENDEKSKNFLFFIDEGELHLHPKAQRSLKNALMELSDKGDQVFINTHSSVLVTDEDARQEIFKVEKISKCTEISSITKENKPYVIYDLLGGNPADLLLPRNFLIVEGRSEKEFLATIIQRFYSHKPAIQIVHADGDHEKQKHTMAGINTVFIPLFTSPIYKNTIIIVCDTPHPDKLEDFNDFKKAYDYLERQGQLFTNPKQNLEEYYPSPWVKTQEEIKELSSASGKTKLAKEVGEKIDKEQFEKEMVILFEALEKCWENAY